jgi:hypothetical protein
MEISFSRGCHLDSMCLQQCLEALRGLFPHSQPLLHYRPNVFRPIYFHVYPDRRPCVALLLFSGNKGLKRIGNRERPRASETAIKFVIATAAFSSMVHCQPTNDVSKEEVPEGQICR